MGDFILTLSKLLMAFVLVATVVQSVVCFAENANLLSCIHEARQDCDNTTTGQSDQFPGESESRGCKHDICHKLLAVSEEQTLVVASEKYPKAYFSLRSFLPESPVAEIDHPPKLS